MKKQKPNKILYVIPGFGECTSDPVYKEIIALAQKSKITVVLCDIKWERRTPDNWVTEFLNKVREGDSQYSIVLGFSFGAYIAALASEKVPFDELILCSMSPYFKEDLKFIPKDSLSFFGVRRVRNFQKNKTPHFSKKTTFYFGDKDWGIAIKKAQKLAQKSKKSKLVLIKNAGHNLSHPAYLQTIKDYIKNK